MGNRILSQPVSQRGVALIMVLGMVAIIAAWASTAAYEDMVSLRRATNIQDELHATMANESALAASTIAFKEDQNNPLLGTPDYDSLEDIWTQIPPWPLDEGMIAVTIEDANRYYNLNDLVDDKGIIIQAHFTQLQEMFSRLDINPGLVNALADWMDKNSTPYGASGAEDSSYYDKDYKVKNARLDNWSELKLIHGFDAEVLSRLITVASVFPTKNNGSSTININTAPAETLMSIFPNMTNLDFESLDADRPYDSKNNINLAAQPWAKGGDQNRLSVKSDIFMMRAHASFGQANVREEFLLSRSGSIIQLIRRERLGWQF